MRVDVVKVLFLGVENERPLFFKQAQEKGVIEFIAPRLPKGGEGEILLQKYTGAIKILRGLTPVEQAEGVRSHKAPHIAEKIIALHARIHQMQEEERLLAQEIEKTSILGNFSLSDFEYIEKETGRKFRFFFRIIRPTSDLKPLPEAFIPIGLDNGMEYFFTLEKTIPPHHDLIEFFVTKPASQLQKELELLRGELKKWEGELKEFAQYNQFLHDEILHLLNTLNLKNAEEAVSKTLEDKIFTIIGWVPKTKLNDIKELCGRLNVFYEIIEIENHDLIPTYLENHDTSKIGEDLVHIYDTPSITDKDPSPWVLWSFILFFALIINDAGYGLVFLLGSLFVYFKYPHLKGFKKRIVQLSIILSFACVLVGVSTTSFFGMQIAAENPIRKLSFVDYLTEKKAAFHMQHKDEVYHEWVGEYPELASISNTKEFLNFSKPSPSNPSTFLYPLRDNFSGTIMFELALMIGTIHVILSILRNLRRSWAGVGWILFMIGGYLYFPVMLKAVSIIHFAFGINPTIGAEIGIQLIYGGIGLAIILALIQKRVGGALEFMVLIQIFCDVLSYLRLYALGLAGMMMGSTFNEMAGMTGPIFGTLIILAGHTINMAMGIMGGVIHGLRLNFLEWYHYSFEGGGKMFKPLALLKKD